MESRYQNLDGEKIKYAKQENHQLDLVQMNQHIKANKDQNTICPHVGQQ
jgi:hypothetical protein